MVRRTRSRFWKNFTECWSNDSKRMSQADGTQFALGGERLITSTDETGHIDLSRARRARAACGRRLVFAPDADSNSNPFAKSATAANADSSADAASAATQLVALPVYDEETSVRLQIFLDNHEFGPGKIDGKMGEFFGKALVAYKKANGMPESGAVDGRPPRRGAEPYTAASSARRPRTSSVRPHRGRPNRRNSRR